MRSDRIRLLIVGVAGTEIADAARMAREQGADVAMVETRADALTALRDRDVGLVMIDVSLDVGGFMSALAAERIAVPVLGCGIAAPAERAVAAIRAGAQDYVPLPPDRAMIAAALACAATRPVPELVGNDPALALALRFGRSMAPSAVPILIVGETGTGKETLARTIHDASERSGPFLTLACAGVAPDLIESELFGHAAGDFPGALASRTGKLDQAAGGTLFIRDLDCLPAPLQARLTDAIRRTPDARIVAATKADLPACVAAGAFRADLLAHFSTAGLRLPPLRERQDDIPALAAHCVARLAARHDRLPRGIRDDALSLLVRYEWPGNVRELEDMIHRALVLAKGPMIAPEDLVLADGNHLAAPADDGEPSVGALVGRTVEDVERALILRTLERCRGNRTSASGILGISVRTMRNKLKTFIDAGIAVAPAGPGA